MSNHRVITDLAGIEALNNGAVVLDRVGDVMHLDEGDWYCGASRYDAAEVMLPARVLIESWER